VIGVAAEGFDGVDLDATDVWRPANYMSTGGKQPWYQARNGGFLQIIGRVRPGADEADLLRRANLAFHEGADRFDTQTTLLLGPVIMARGPDSQEREQKLAVGLAAVTLIVLLIAVANVGNLLLTRAIERRREVAVRIALGVSRRRLAAQMLTESVVLATAAGMAATLVGMWGALLLRGLLMPATRWADGPLDLRLVAFTFGVALAAGLASGVLPLFQTRSLDLASSMRGTARDGTGYRSRARASLIIAQAALSVILLTGAALFLRSLQAVRALDIGFDADHMIVGRVLAGDRAIPATERSAALTEVRARVASLPGVRAAGLANMPPMWGFSSERLFIAGRDSVPKTAAGPPTFMAVSPEYFAAAGVSIARGRSFTGDDGPGAPLVAVVTRTMARMIWGESRAVGQCMRIEKPDAPCTTIVGVMEDLRRGDVIEEPTLQFYLPLKQRGAGLAGAVIVAADPERIPDLERELQALIRQAVPGGIAEVNTLADRLEPQYRPWRVGARLFMAFGALALLVASIGIYSAISYAVTRRSHELGVRMALGARRTQVARLVVGSGVRVVASGVAIGVVASLFLSGPVGSMLYGTDPRDPAVLAGVAVILLGVACLAAALPAWRATRLDPVRALRAE
jgi:putative ABC transport system permease protein